MFQSNEAINIKIIVDGKKVLVPGITTCSEYTADRTNRATGALVPSRFVNVISYHVVPAEYSRTTEPNIYYKNQRQAAAFMEYRTTAVPELDELTADELLAKVAESLDKVQMQTQRVRLALAGNAVKPKATFGTTPAPVLVTA